jgi:hypothetical protein
MSSGNKEADMTVLDTFNFIKSKPLGGINPIAVRPEKQVTSRS